MTPLEEKHCDVLMTNGLSYVELSKECAKITLQHCIDVLRGIEIEDNWLVLTVKIEVNSKVSELEKQLSDLNK